MQVSLFIQNPEGRWESLWSLPVDNNSPNCEILTFHIIIHGLVIKVLVG